MDDLISRQAVIDIIHKEIERTSTFSEHETQINIEMAVNELPTAYDVEKVVEALKVAGNQEVRNAFGGRERMEAIACCNGIEKAIKIVRNGGV